MSILLAAVGGNTPTKRLDTSGTTGVISPTSPLVWGYSDGAAGTLTDDDYSDFSGNTRTIVALAQNEDDSTLTFTLGSGVPNNETVFSFIKVNSETRLYRSSASYSDGAWTWATTTPFSGGDAEPYTLEVWA